LNERAVRGLAETMALGGAKMEALRLLDEYGAEVGALSSDLKLSTDLLKRRIRERLPNHYRATGSLPFAGRDVELLELRRHLARSQAEASQAVVIVGDPGIGKTRLIAEFGALAAFEDTSIQRVTAHPKSSGRPMGVLIDLVSALVQLPGALGVSPDSMQALRRLTHSSPSSAADPITDNTPDAISHAIDHALRDLLSAISAETHLTIVIDDAHWADPVSLRLLFDLAENEDTRLLLIIATRDCSLANEHAGGTAFATIPLRALERDCVMDLSRRCLHGSSAEQDRELQLWMAQIAQGNPLFLESLIGHYRATGELFKVPSSLHDLLAQRLAALQPSTIAVLQICVLLDALCIEKRLLACLEIRFVELIAALNELRRLRLIDSDAGRIVAAHPLIAEVLLAQSDGAVLRLIHRQIARTLELETGAHESTALLWDSAHHWSNAGEHDRALATFRKCADHAAGIGRPADAAAVLLKAAKLELTDTARVDVLRDAVHAAQSAGEFDLVLEGVSGIRRLGGTTAHDNIELAEFAAMSVVFVDSVDFSSRVLECLSSSEADSSHRVSVGLAALKYADTYSVPTLAHSVAGAISDCDLSAASELTRLEFQMVCQAALGRPVSAVPFAKCLRRLAESLPAAAAQGALLNAGHAFWRAGLLQDSRSTIERVYDLAERCGALRRQRSAAMQLAIMLCDQGDADVSGYWRLKVSDLRKSCPWGLGEFELTLFEIEFAFFERDVCLAKEILAIADRKDVFSSAIRLRWRRYIDARMRQLSGEARLSNEELEGFLLDSNDASSTSGIREAEMAVICVGLFARSRFSEARERLRKFLEWRSHYSLGALPRQLQEVVAECRFADLLSKQIAPTVF
jgi:hypothetical protein